MRPTTNIDAELLKLAATQDAVVAAHQLADLGIRGRGLDGRRRRGLLHRLLPGVYSVGVRPSEVPRRGWEMAAQLRPRSPVRLSHESAATRFGLWQRADAAAPIHVTCEGAACTITPDGCRVGIVTHRSRRRMSAADAVRDGASWVSSPLQTCIDLGSTHRPLQITSVIREATWRGDLDVAELRSRLGARAGVPGSAIVTAALDWYELGSSGTRSRSEDALDCLLEQAGLPMPLVNVRNATGMPGVEADFVWPAHRVIVKIDGGHHRLPGARDFDEARDEALRAAGWTILRFDFRAVWNRPWDVVAAVHRALGHCRVAPRAIAVPEHLTRWMRSMGADGAPRPTVTTG